jgi:glycosyltransferase involved in cell wall biosynthesis
MNKTTICVVSYNQESYIKESVQSALNQDYPNLEVIISDDASTDGTFEIIENVVSNYNGPHKVIVNRNNKNMGVIEHINFVVFNLINTQYFILQAGDDISLSNRVSEIMKVFINEKPSSICTNAIKIDEHNNEYGQFIKDNTILERKRYLKDFLIQGSNAFGASMAYDIEIFRFFGQIPLTVRNEDFILNARASLLNGMKFHNKNLIKYRIHEESLSLRIYADDKYFKKIQLLLQVFKNRKNNLEHLSEMMNNKNIEINYYLFVYSYMKNFSDLWINMTKETVKLLFFKKIH